MAIWTDKTIRESIMDDRDAVVTAVNDMDVSGEATVDVEFIKRNIIMFIDAYERRMLKRFND